MKSPVTTSVLSVFAFLLLAQCAKPVGGEKEPVLPDTADSSAVYLNGTLTDYAADFVSYPNTNVISYGFRQRRGGYVNQIYITGPVDLGVGKYGKYLDFFQIHGYDQTNHKYALINPEEAVFQITSVNKETKRAKGNFQAVFRRTLMGTNTPDSQLPDTLSFKGTFNAVWREY